MTTQKKELLSIDYLRGIASFGVVLFHVRLFLWVGWNQIMSSSDVSKIDKLVAYLSIPTPFMGSGVNLFFLLSGFCIALPYTKAIDRKFEFKEYFLRRFFRIYPPYLIAIFLTLGIDLLLTFWNMTFESKPYFYSFFMLQNYVPTHIESNGSLWSLPIEMELYLFFPILYFLFRKFGNVVSIFITAIISFIAMGLYFKGYEIFGSIFLRYLFLWSAGALLAELYTGNRLKRPNYIFIITSILSLGIAVYFSKRLLPIELDYFYGFFFFVLLWFCITTEDIWLKYVPSILNKCLLQLGTISFSLYLIHYPIFKICGVLWERQFGHKPINFSIPVLFSIGVCFLAYLFYRFVERPTHLLAKSLSKRKSSISKSLADH